VGDPDFTPSNTMCRGAPRVFPQNGISIRSAICAQSFTANVKNHNVYALCSLLSVFFRSRLIIFLPNNFCGPIRGPRDLGLGPRFIELPGLPVSLPLVFVQAVTTIC